MKHLRFTPLVALLLCLSCAPSIAPFDQASIDRTVTLRVETLSLMDKAIHPFLQYSEDVEELFLKLEVAQELARIRPKNQETWQQWELMTNPETGTIRSFFSSWERDTTRSATMISNKKKTVGAGFDEILKLEKQKLKWE